MRSQASGSTTAMPSPRPPRTGAAGYQGLSVLVLSGGAERLRPEQWAAIRHWVLDGGSLIFVGGGGGGVPARPRCRVASACGQCAGHVAAVADLAA